MARPHEYIGVSGVVNQEQQAELEEVFAETGLADKRKLQLGVKATHKAQYLGIENKYGREWYPVGHEINEVMGYSPNVMGVAQVCLDPELTHDDVYRRAFLERSLGTAAWQWVTGIQYDMVPNWCCQADLIDTMVAEAALVVNESHFPAFEQVPYLDGRALLYRGAVDPKATLRTVTLQCQNDVMNHHTPRELAERLSRIPELDYALLDASGGRGIRLNPDALLPYLEAIYDNPHLSRLGVAIGGGLNAEVVRTELPKILRHFPDVSWDAEGQLHPVNADGKRPLDMQVVREYFEASAEVLR